MTIWIESNPRFEIKSDAYGRVVLESVDSKETVQALVEYLRRQQVIADKNIRIVSITNAATTLDSIGEEDLLFSIYITLYGISEGKGLRGYYRSTKQLNSEKCKALSITVTKAAKDFTELYYHGVYNEDNVAADLDSIVKSRCLAAGIEVGFTSSEKAQLSSTTLHKNLAEGLGRGIVRHLSAQH